MPGGYGIAGPFPTDEEPFIEKVEQVRELLEPRALTRTMFVPWGPTTCRRSASCHR